MIPPHVAAYAAGMLTAGPDDYDRGARKAATIIALIGLGSYEPEELRLAALKWLRAHVSEDVVDTARARLLARKAGRT